MEHKEEISIVLLTTSEKYCTENRVNCYCVVEAIIFNTNISIVFSKIIAVLLLAIILQCHLQTYMSERPSMNEGKT